MNTERDDFVTVHAIRQFLEEHYQENNSIESICRQFGLNRTKLQESFNQWVGLPVHAFIFKVRMEKAKSILTGTDDTIKSIAYEVGYKSVSGFTRAFTRLHGLSPQEYRRQTLT